MSHRVSTVSRREFLQAGAVVYTRIMTRLRQYSAAMERLQAALEPSPDSRKRSTADYVARYDTEVAGLRRALRPAAAPPGMPQHSRAAI